MLKFEELGYDDYENKSSEYEFLYIGTCNLECLNLGHTKTGYKFSYEIYSRMLNNTNYSLEYFFSL